MTTAVPLFVVATFADATGVLRRLARTGWKTREGFALPVQQWDVGQVRMVCHGRVADPDTARLALLAAVRGASVVAITDVTSGLGQEFLADLGRVGVVTTDLEGWAAGGSGDGDGGPQLAVEQRALLDRLAAGETIAAAAAAEFLSLRTANRRIAEARELLGVRTTREAVLAYLRHRRDQVS